MTQQEVSYGSGLQGASLPAPVEDEWAGIVDTYSFGGTKIFQIDRKQSITFKILNEGEKRRFQSMTNRDIKLNRKTDEAAFRPDAAADRHALILVAVVDWTLYTRSQKNPGEWERLAFTEAMLRNWLSVTDPKIVEDLENEIRKANPWLNAEDATIEELEEAIVELQIQLDQKKASEAGKAS